MNLKKLISLLCKVYSEQCAQRGIKVSMPAPYSIDLLAEPTERQMEQLESGSGNPIAEMHQINSSAGMAFNYYKLFEEATGITVDFEWQDSIPLLKSTFPANIDVRYETEDGVITFVECKFLEPYYSGCERNRPAYTDPDRYPFTDHREEWIGLMQKESEFKFYNIAQIFRHMLAIYRHTLEHPEIYEGKKIVLKSIMWRMPEAYLERYNQLEKGRNNDKNKTRLEELSSESAKAEELINAFASQIGWADFSFSSEYYNDITDAIKSSSRYDDFMRIYGLE